MPVRRVRWWVLALIVGAGCGAGDGSSGSGSGTGSGSGSAEAEQRAPVRVKTYEATGPAQVSLATPAMKLPMQESFTLLEPGAGARTLLRYTPDPEPVVYRAAARLRARQIVGDALPPPLALPEIRDGFELAAPADGPLELRVLPVELGTTASADARAAGEQYITPWRTRLAGRRASAQLDARGQLGSVTFHDDPATTRSAAARDDLVQRLVGLAIPLPLEPVGVGARWRVVTILRQGPAYAKQTATYTLRAATPTRWTIAVEVRRVAEEQRFEDPALPAGATADLVAMFKLFTGELTASPRHPLPIAGTLTVESRLHARLQLAGQPPADQVYEDTGTLTLSLDALAKR